MVPEIEKPQITEIHVRMDCNGCVHKIKKALHSIEGVYDTYIDFPQQKLTVVGRASPENIIKAIKKTRKIATICSHTEPPEPPAAEAAAASSDPPVPDAAANQPPTEAPPPEAAPPPTDQTKEATPLENPAPEVKPSTEAADAATSQPDGSSSEPKDVGEIHMIHHYPHHQVYQDHWSDYPLNGYGVRNEAPYYVTHSYSSHRPSTNISEYYGHTRSPPQNVRYTTPEPYSDDHYHTRGSSEGNNITSMFSDENPNACIIV